jgi:alkylated DNA repair dioxygenase AlkB
MALLGRGAPAIDPTFAGLARIDLDESAWVERVDGWVSGHDQLFDEIVHGTRWHSDERQMYDRMVEVPRLTAGLPADGVIPAIVEQMRAALSARYRTAFTQVSLGYYRDGNDSVAWHGDYVARNLPDAIVATVSLGAPRRFLLRRTAGGQPGGGSGKSTAFMLGWGDLTVMGGSCQRTWQHSIPKVAQAGPRVAVMFRPDWYRR